MKQLDPKKGFTLIELIVVIAIISLLSSVVMSSINSARARARDAVRMSSLRSVVNALEIFYSANGRYPSAVDGNCTYPTSFLPGGCLQALVSGGYISVLPTEPSSSLQYNYDNWCNVPNGTSDKQYRMWTLGEFNHNGLANNWWSNNNIGYTTCQDQS